MLRRVCAVSYVLMLDETMRRAHTKALIDGISGAMGAETEVEDPAYVRIEFDKRLAEEPPNMDSDEQALRAALGIGMRG